MIQLYTNDIKIDVHEDNPIYGALKELDGKFVGVSVTESPPPAPQPVPEPKELVYFNSEKYLQVIQDNFGKTTTFALLSSVLDRFVSRIGPASPVYVNKTKLLNYRLAEDLEGYKLLIPEEFIVSDPYENNDVVA